VDQDIKFCIITASQAFKTSLNRCDFRRYATY